MPCNSCCMYCCSLALKYKAVRLDEHRVTLIQHTPINASEANTNYRGKLNEGASSAGVIFFRS